MQVKNVQRSASAKILDGESSTGAESAAQRQRRKSSFPRLRNPRDYLSNKGMKPNNALRKGLLLEK